MENNNKNFVDIYGNTLEQLSKEDLIKIIAIIHNVNMRIGNIVTTYQEYKRFEIPQDIIFNDIAKVLQYSNIPFYNKAEDLKEYIDNMYNG